MKAADFKLDQFKGAVVDGGGDFFAAVVFIGDQDNCEEPKGDFYFFKNCLISENFLECCGGGAVQHISACFGNRF